jgi:hypothetical protein
VNFYINLYILSVNIVKIMLTDYFNLSLLKTIINFISILAIQQSFLNTSIIFIRAYKHRADLVVEKIMSEEDATDTIYFIGHIALGFIVLVLAGMAIANNVVKGLINLSILLCTSYLLVRIPLKEIKIIRNTLRISFIIFKKRIYNYFFSPIYLFIIAFILLISTVFW